MKYRYFAVRIGDHVEIRKTLKPPIGIRSKLFKLVGGKRKLLLDQTFYSGGAVVSHMTHTEFYNRTYKRIPEWGILEVNGVPRKRSYW